MKFILLIASFVFLLNLSFSQDQLQRKEYGPPDVELETVIPEELLDMSGPNIEDPGDLRVSGSPGSTFLRFRAPVKEYDNSGKLISVIPPGQRKLKPRKELRLSDPINGSSWQSNKEGSIISGNEFAISSGLENRVQSDYIAVIPDHEYTLEFKATGRGRIAISEFDSDKNILFWHENLDAKAGSEKDFILTIITGSDTHFLSVIFQGLDSNRDTIVRNLKIYEN